MKARHYLLFGSLALIISVLVAAPHIKEYKKYKKALKGDDITLCDMYLAEYPQHKHTEIIRQRKEALAYEMVLNDKNPETCDWYLSELPRGEHREDVYYLRIKYSRKTIPIVNDYLYKYPNGKYADTVNRICDSLWDSEIAKYQSKDKKKVDPKASKYMLEMLEYMKEHRIYTVNVNVQSTLQLKEYEEYPLSLRKELEDDFRNEPLPLKGNVISLKSNFKQGDIADLQKILIDGVQQSFDNMFTPGFITAQASDNDGIKPNLTFTYTIKSQESHGYPTIWECYTTSYTALFSSFNRKVEAYLIGISIQFKASFTLPNSTTQYDYSQKGEPENNISNIQNIRDGYKKMTEACFRKFSDKMSVNLGLNPAYILN